MLANAIQGIAAGSQLYAQHRQAKAEEAYRNRQLGIAESAAADEKAYRNELLGIKKDEAAREKIESAAKIDLTKAQTGLAQAGQEASKFELERAKTKAALDDEAERLRKENLARTEQATSKLGSLQATSPFALDYDTTFSDEQLMTIDKEKAPQWIALRNRAAQEFEGVAARIASVNPAAAAEFRQRMAAANANADEKIKNALAKQQFESLEGDSMFAEADAEGLPNQNLLWFQQTKARIDRGETNYAQAMLERDQQQRIELDKTIRLSRRQSLMSDISGTIKSLSDYSAQNNLPYSQRLSMKSEIEGLFGLLQQVKNSPDANIGELASKYGEIVSGGGKQKLTNEEVQLLKLFGQGTPKDSLLGGIGVEPGTAAAAGADGITLGPSPYGLTPQESRAAAQQMAAKYMGLDIGVPGTAAPGTTAAGGATPGAAFSAFLGGPLGPANIGGPGTGVDTPPPPPPPPPETTPQPPESIPGERFVGNLTKSSQEQLDAVLARKKAGEKGAKIAEELRDAQAKVAYAKKNSEAALSSLKSISEGISFLKSTRNGAYAFDLEDIFSTGIETKEQYESAMRGVSSALGRVPFLYPARTREAAEHNKIRRRIRDMKDSLSEYGQAMGFVEEG